MLAAKIAITTAIICSTFFPTTTDSSPANLSENSKQEALVLVNRLRAQGCHCGQRYMPPVGPVAWLHPLLVR